MDKKESEFLAKLLVTFKTEAEEHLNALTTGLLSLEKVDSDQQKKNLIEIIFREAHSLKGAARSVNYDSIQSICQSLENVLAALKRDQVQLKPQSFDTLYASIDLIGKIIQLPPKAEPQERKVELNLLINRLDQLISAKNATPSENALSTPTPTSSALIPSAALASTTTPQEQQITDPVLIATEEEVEISSDNPDQPFAIEPDKTIRVSQRKLDQLFQEVEEMLLLKLAALHQINDLKRMQEELKRWEKKWIAVQSDYLSLREDNEKNINSGSSKRRYSNVLKFVEWQQKFMKAFKENINILSKISSLNFRQAGGIVDTLIEDTRRILMQPFSVLLEIFPRMVRDISHSQNKEVQFEIVGDDIEVDRRILEEMKNPLIHLIRNAIDHGIELPAVRLENNKPSCGNIKIVASQLSGRSMEILISDDGQGVNCSKIKKKAISLGLLSEKEASAQTEQETLKLIFQPEVSTSSIITEISGRGIGLEIVAEKVDSLGGQISIETFPGKGTTFKIVLPLTLTTFRGLLLKISDTLFIIPSNNVKKVIHLKNENLKSVEGRQILSLDEVPIAYLSLNDILQIAGKKPVKNHNYAIIIKSGDNIVALGIDEAISEQEMLVKPFGPHLKRVKNILGATITESGDVILILNPQDLIKSLVKSNISDARSHVSKKNVKIKKKNILVVEDSMTSRMLLKNILETAGYEVKTAIDGLEGLSLFKLNPYDLVLSDVEMPNMDGFTLASKIRNLENGKAIPIVLCTSRNTPADRERGIDVGANAYFEKSNFTQGKFLETIKKLL